MNNLDRVGKIIINKVRDESIDKSKEVLDGALRSSQAQSIYSNLNHLQQSDKEEVMNLVRLSVDSTLHNLLWLIEGSPYIDLVTFFNDNEEHLSEESDGLSGELYGDDGWIKRFSKHPHTY